MALLSSCLAIEGAADERAVGGEQSLPFEEREIGGAGAAEFDVDGDRDAHGRYTGCSQRPYRNPPDRDASVFQQRQLKTVHRCA
jgi:hypothetical protein